MLISPSNIGWIYLQKALGPFLDVDIYENVKQISQCQMTSEISSFFFSIFSSFHYWCRSEFTMCFREKKIIPLEIIEIKRFALHFHKCPHPEKGLIPFVKIFSQYFLAIQAFTFAQSEVRDPVSQRNGFEKSFSIVDRSHDLSAMEKWF